jgi:hypothetical protein
MSKRKSKSSQKPDAVTPRAAKPAATPKRAAVPAASLAGSEGEVLESAPEIEAAPETETRLPDLPGQEAETNLPATPPLELVSEPALPPDLVEPTPDVALPVGTPVEAQESTGTATGEPRPADPSPKMDGPRRAITGMEACQLLFMEMTRDNLDFAASLAAMRSPLDMLGVASEFASRRIGMYGRFSKAIADIAGGRQAPMS